MSAKNKEIVEKVNAVPPWGATEKGPLCRLPSEFIGELVALGNTFLRERGHEPAAGGKARAGHRQLERHR
jgi:hypothetical protein